MFSVPCLGLLFHFLSPVVFVVSLYLILFSLLASCVYILWHVSRAPISVALATEEIHLHAITAGWSVPAEAAQERATKAGTTQSLVSNDSRRQPTNDTLCFLPESSWPISPPHEHWTPNPLHAAGRRTGSRSTGESLQTRGTFTSLCLFNKHTLRGPFCTITCRVILQPATLVENAGRLLKNHRHPTITVTSLFLFPSPPPPPPFVSVVWIFRQAATPLQPWKSS